MFMEDIVSDTLRELQRICKEHEDQKAIWIFYAVNRYYGRASSDFRIKFMQYPHEDFRKLIDKCLKGDLSDNGIIKTIEREIKCTR